MKKILVHLVLLSLGALAFAGATLIPPMTAHAAADPVATAPALLDWAAYAKIALAAGVGAVTVLGVLQAGLTWLAPRTKTTLDDRIRDDVKLLHDKLDGALRLLGGLFPAAGVPSTGGDKPAAAPLNIVPSPRDSQAGFIRFSVMGAIAGAGLALFVVLACSATQARQTAASGVVAALVCEDAHIDAQALADAKSFAEARVQAWIAGGKAPDAAKIKADLAPIKSDLGRCAIAGALAAMTAAIQPAPTEAVQGLTAAGAGGSMQARAAFAVAARQLGWAPVKVVDGTVL